MISVNGEIGIGVMVELCQGVLDGKGMPAEWVLSECYGTCFQGERGSNELWGV